VLNFLFNTK